MENIEIPTSMLALIPIVALIVQNLKKMSAMGTLKEYLPVISVAIAVSLAYLTSGQLENWSDPILPAIAIGLMASGGYDVLKGKTGP